MRFWHTYPSVLAFFHLFSFVSHHSLLLLNINLRCSPPIPVYLSLKHFFRTIGYLNWLNVKSSTVDASPCAQSAHAHRPHLRNYPAHLPDFYTSQLSPFCSQSFTNLHCFPFLEFSAHFSLYAAYSVLIWESLLSTVGRLEHLRSVRSLS